MFISYDSSLIRNGKYAMLWRLSTGGQKQIKKFSRADYMERNVIELCNSLKQKIPSGKLSHRETSSKFSLYLFAHLIYGLSVVLERKIFYLEMDLRMFYEKVKEFRYVTVLETSIKSERKPRKSRKRVSIDAMELDDNPNLDSLEQLDFALVAKAKPSEITLNEDLGWNKPSLFNMEDDLVPMTAQQLEAFGDCWISSNATGSNREDILTLDSSASKRLKVSDLPAKDPHPVSLEDLDKSTPEKGSPLYEAFPLNGLDGPNLIPDFPENLLDDRTPERASPIDAAQNILPDVVNMEMDLHVSPVANPLAPEEMELARFTKSPDDLMAAQLIDLPGATPTRKSPILMELDIVDPKPVRRRRRHRRLVQEEKTTISYEEMRGAMEDDSSKIDPAELRVTVPGPEINPTDILTAVPLWMKEGDPRMDLYRSFKRPRLALEDAEEMGFAPLLDRGTESRLWHFDDSRSSSNRSSMDIMNNPWVSEREPLLATGKSPGYSYPKSPEREAIEVPRTNESLFDPTMPNIPFDPQPSPDFGFPNKSISPPVFVQNEDHFLLKQPSSLASSQCSINRNLDVDDAISSALDQFGTVAFSDIFPPRKTSRVRAAKGFYSLLVMLKHRKIEVSQDSFCGQISISSTCMADNL